jgi:sugar phosphate isomerase/epimerase
MEPDEKKRQANIDAMKKGLALADEVGAQCVVNIGGSRSPTNWAGAHLDNMSDESYEMAIATAREIIDAVKPKRAKMTYEPMPFCIPDSPASYLRLIEAIDRPEFGVHMDAVNFINGTDRFVDTTSVIKESFEKLGRHVVACHLKDITMDPQCLTVPRSSRDAGASEDGGGIHAGAGVHGQARSRDRGESGGLGVSSASHWTVAGADLP